ncbi:MAG: hypothetical protein DHS20C17_28670 [Cyclobacteriaceae bacterium]|nr:MAG: hypothetical protein DHS20C17_28670 [Cyclobacteriaceae bacterium]
MSVRVKDILNKKEGKYLFVDIIMMFLLLVNLSLILFDYLFGSDLFKGLFQKYTPGFYQFYDTYIHQDFLAIDLWFVSIFVIELLVRWAIAIKNQKYHRWFFYPFMHWYDVLGCLPLGSFRFFRILRIVGLTIRLHKLGFVNLTRTYVYKKAIKYLNIITEEISDRVVLHVLSGVQSQIEKGNPVLEQIVHDLILPKRRLLVDWLSYNLQEATSAAYEAHIDDLQYYVNQKLMSAIESNRELKTVSKIPIVGGIVTYNLERTVRDIVNSVVDESFRDLASPKNKEVVDDVANLVLDSFVYQDRDTELNNLVRDIVLDSLELVKDQVRIQQWKIREELTNEIREETNPTQVVEDDHQST